MTGIAYGVVRLGDRWSIIAPHIRFGDFEDRQSAVAAAERLARQAGGVDVDLHVQDQFGRLHTRVVAEDLS
jgi:hypothetical protein